MRGCGIFTRRQPFIVAVVQCWAGNSPTRNERYDVVSLDARWDRLYEEELAQACLDRGLLL